MRGFSALNLSFGLVGGSCFIEWRTVGWFYDRSSAGYDWCGSGYDRFDKVYERLRMGYVRFGKLYGRLGGIYERSLTL